MKALLASTLLFILLAAGSHAQQVPAPATAPTFEQQRTASSAATAAPKTYFFQTITPAFIESLKVPEITEEQKRQHADLGAALARWENEKQAAAMREAQAANAAVYEARKAEIQRQLEVRLAQIRATNYVTPTAPVQPQTVNREPRTVNREPRTGTTTVISGSGGVYRTTGGPAGGATIINTAPGHYEVRQNGQTQRVIITTP